MSFQSNYFDKTSPYEADTKRNRTKMNKKQFEALDFAFKQDIFPNCQKRIELARQTGLPLKTIQIWFQNQRQRAKTMEDDFKLNIMRQVLSRKEARNIPEELIPLEILSELSTIEFDQNMWKRQNQK
ncbi:Double homeobox protein 4-like protein 7 [Cucumispora dikerogammari]|nr:Double homeobox protein 4-like protein 7 [Cucumispora dikerogammari]